ncbi:hypothetical protein PMIN06_009162 [Paraphaeosphaeria minitans]
MNTWKKPFCVRTTPQSPHLLQTAIHSISEGPRGFKKDRKAMHRRGAKMWRLHAWSRAHVEGATVGRVVASFGSRCHMTLAHRQPASPHRWGASDGAQDVQNRSQALCDAAAHPSPASQVPWPPPLRRRTGASPRINQTHRVPFQTLPPGLAQRGLLMSSHGLEKRHAGPGRSVCCSEAGTPSAVCSCQWRLCLHREDPTQLSWVGANPTQQKLARTAGERVLPIQLPSRFAGLTLS